MDILSKRIAISIAYLSGILWLITGLLYLALGNKVSVYFPYSHAITDTSLTSFANSIGANWSCFMWVNSVSIAADILLVFLGVVISSIFEQSTSFLKNLIIIVLAIGGFFSVIEDILNYPIYHVLGIMAPLANHATLSSIAVLFSVFSDAATWLPIFGYLLGAFGLIITIFMTKPYLQVSSLWKRYSYFLAILFLATFFISIITLLTGNNTLLIISLTLIMLATPLAYLIWVFGLHRQCNRIYANA